MVATESLGWIWGGGGDSKSPEKFRQSPLRSRAVVSLAVKSSVAVEYFERTCHCSTRYSRCHQKEQYTI